MEYRRKLATAMGSEMCSLCARMSYPALGTMNNTRQTPDSVARARSYAILIDFIQSSRHAQLDMEARGSSSSLRVEQMKSHSNTHRRPHPQVGPHLSSTDQLLVILNLP